MKIQKTVIIVVFLHHKIQIETRSLRKKWVKDISNLLTELHPSKKQGKEFTDKSYKNVVRRWGEIIAPVIEGYNQKNKRGKTSICFGKAQTLILEICKR